MDTYVSRILRLGRLVKAFKPHGTEFRRVTKLINDPAEVVRDTPLGMASTIGRWKIRSIARSGQPRVGLTADYRAATLPPNGCSPIRPASMGVTTLGVTSTPGAILGSVPNTSP